MNPKIESSLGIIGESSILATRPNVNPKMDENKTEYAICFLPTLILVRILLDFKNILIINLPSGFGNTFLRLSKLIFSLAILQQSGPIHEEKHNSCYRIAPFNGRLNIKITLKTLILF